MCKGSNTTTTVQQPEIPGWLEGAFQGVVNKASQAAQIPFNPATFKNVAGFAGDQNAAFQQARDMVGNWQPYLGQAAGYAQNLGSPIAPSAIQNYTNPFQSQVIDATMANIGQNNALQQQQIAGNAALQGALGGDRVKVAQAELARQQNLATNQTLANLNAQNYNQALGAAQADRTAAGNAATQFGSLANQVSALGAGDYSRLLAQGGLQQGLAQQMLDTSSGNAAMQSQFPFAVTGWEQGIYSGASPTFTGYTSTQTQPSPNPLNSILGLGAMGLGAFLSDERVKEDAEPVGKLFDGTTVYKYRMVGDPRAQIGVMAQEVEQRTPEAVHEVGGLKLVNYDKATEKAEGLAARPRFAEGGEVGGERQLMGSVTFGGRRGSQPQSSGVPYFPKSYVPGLSQTIGATQTPALAKPPPPPKLKDEDQDDPVKMFREAKAAAQGMNAGLGQIIGKLDTTSGPGGWSTSVQPTMTGLGNYLGNMMGRASGGRVGYKKGGDVEGEFPLGGTPDNNVYHQVQRWFGNVPGWIAQGLAGSQPVPTEGVPPLPVFNGGGFGDGERKSEEEFGSGWKTPEGPRIPLDISNVASGVSTNQMAGYLPGGAQFNPLGGNFGAYVDTDSLLSGSGAPTNPAFGNVATGILPTPQPPASPSPTPDAGAPGAGSGGGGGVGEGGEWSGGGGYTRPKRYWQNDFDYAAATGGRIMPRRGYQDGGPVDPSQMPQQMPQGAAQAGLGAAPGMMPQGMPMAAPAAPMGLGMPMGGMMPGMMPPGMPPMGGAAGPMPALPPPGAMQAPMPPPQPQQGGLGQPIRIPPRSAPYGRKVLEKQMAREKGLGAREGFQEGGVVDGYYDPEEDIWKVPQNVSETPGASIGTDASSPSSSPSMFENARSGKYSWLAEPLISAGAAMMASRSPFVGPAIGEGGLAGIRSYREAQKADALEQKAREQMDLRRAQFAETKKMNKLRAEEAELRLGELRDPNLPYERRAQVLERFGLDPDSSEGRAFILTGKLPSSMMGGVDYGKTGAIFQGEDGRYYTVQFGADGTRKIEPVVVGGGDDGDGQMALSPAKGVITVDEGTGTRIIDKSTGQDVRAIPKDLEEAERLKGLGSEVGKGQGRMASPEARVKRVEAETHLATAVHNLDRLAAEAKAIRDNPSLWRATGAMSSLWSVPGGEAANIDAAMTTLRSQTGFGVLQAMRDASKTGGALGQVSNIENELLQNNLAALSQSQSTEAFKENLDKIIAYTDAAKGRLTGAYLQTYGDEFDPSKFAPGKLKGRLDGPTPGTVEDGYRFKGGDPSDSANWEKVN